VGFSKASVSTELCSNGSLLKVYGKRAIELLKIPFLISIIKQILIGAYLLITHPSYRAQDHK